MENSRFIAAVLAIACTLPACSIKEQRICCPFSRANVSFTGEFYSTPAASSFQFDTEWGTPINGGW